MIFFVYSCIVDRTKNEKLCYLFWIRVYISLRQRRYVFLYKIFFWRIATNFLFFILLSWNRCNIFHYQTSFQSLTDRTGDEAVSISQGIQENYAIYICGHILKNWCVKFEILSRIENLLWLNLTEELFCHESNDWNVYISKYVIMSFLSEL